MRALSLDQLNSCIVFRRNRYQKLVNMDSKVMQVFGLVDLMAAEAQYAL